MTSILFTVICGHHLYSACRVINIIWRWLMIFLITLGLFLCAPSLRPSPPFSTSLPGCPLSSASPLRPSSVTTGVSSITTPAVLSSSLGVFSCVCLVRIPLLRTGKTERMIRTTNDVVRTLLIQASLPPRFWAESHHTATYLLAVASRAAPGSPVVPCADPVSPAAPRAAPVPSPVPARYAQPVQVYRHRSAPTLAPPPAPEAPATPAPEPSPPPPPPAPFRAEPEVSHPPVIHRDPRHIHPMVTQ